MINIQKFNSVHLFLFGPFSPIQSTLSTKVLLCPIWPIRSYFSLFRSNSVHLVHIGSIRSTLVLCCPLWSTLVHAVHIASIPSTLVLFGPFCPLQSYLGHSVHFGLIRSILSTLVRSYERLGNLTLKKEIWVPFRVLLFLGKWYGVATYFFIKKKKRKTKYMTELFSSLIE